MERRRKFVANLAKNNREFYGSHDGRGVLNVIDLAFDHRWVYLYELVQNALDVQANSIAIRTREDGDALVFQHNGERPLDERDVEGLSKVFRSTKGARSVGFMGIGFKSVFARFREARISGWGWKFRYEIEQVVGEQYGDVQRDFLGAVIPIWDENISSPDNGYTTRFELRLRRDGETALGSDLAQFLPESDRSSLAILAMSGLERLDFDGRIWELGICEDCDGSYEVAALSEAESLLWRVFPREFQPSKEAIACFLEHRKISPLEGEREQVYADATRARRVLGVLPLDNDGIAAPPSRGRVYATLPTEVTLPFGLHFNADWLLNMSRGGLCEIEGNAWQREIAGTIADILVRFLEWSANVHTKREAARAAFNAIGEPASEVRGLESLLAEENWQSRFRDQLQHAAVVPVWTNSADNLAYARPGDVIVPPRQIADAIGNRPEMRPETLLNGPVLMHEVLGQPAQRLLRGIGLLTEMSPRELEKTWEGGLEQWWNSLSGDDGNRRALLFRLWAAVDELSDDDEWANLHIRCVRSVTGAWVNVKEATFLNEQLASEGEPGGPQTRRLMDEIVQDANRLDSSWVATLRQRQHEADYPFISQAWNWIEDHAHSISLRDVVEDILAVQISKGTPDCSALIALGHWAKHRNRPDLLSHAFVQSDEEALIAPTSSALLADPYVESRHDRQLLWPDVPLINSAYLATDPEAAGAHEWRTFFERAGARGKLEVTPLKRFAGKRERERAAEFIGGELDSVPESNVDGYTLLDFDIAPKLPAPDTSTELRAAVGPLLEDGFRALSDKGRRKVSCFHYVQKEQTGEEPSTWVKNLCELAWVPSADGELRRPRDVLRESDPAREDAPFSELSSQLLDVLEQEGVKFGEAIPETTSLSRLLSVGCSLEAKELAQLLADCREQATTDADREIYSQALVALEVPTMENRRVKLDRVVQRVGGRLRGPLGGWIVPLDQIDETLRIELGHAGFPHRFPETTTGEQALEYILDVWTRARSSQEGLANEVRDVLPTAYGYVLEDADQDAAFQKMWQEKAPQVMVFSGREWIALNDVEDVYLDDIDDRRFLPKQVQFRTVTAGHLGRTRDEQSDAANAIQLPLLSSFVTRNWIVGDKVSTASNSWEPRFDLICNLLRSAKGSEPAESSVPDAKTSVRLIHVQKLVLEVSAGSSLSERVPVHARLEEETLIVAGRPVQFGADAAKELLRLFSFGQRAGLAADLTGMFNAIEGEDFKLAVEKFGRSHAPEFDWTTIEGAGIMNSDADSSPVDADIVLTEEPEEGEVPPTQRTTSSTTTSQVGPVPASSQTEDGRSGQNHDGLASNRDGPNGGSYGKDRAMAKQNSLARQLRNSLKGEILPDPEGNEGANAAPADEDSGTILGDEKYREIVMRYERAAGRKPELGDAHQAGWDVRSTDPKTGKCRLIEVKGKGVPWDADEVVELSSAQIRKAFEESEHWFLYVVERVDETDYRVLPIESPASIASKWILCGESWRMAADDAMVVTSTLG